MTSSFVTPAAHRPNRARVYLYDTTLRDGAQTNGVDFAVAEKIQIAQQLAALGVDFIEGGWPGANPTDTVFFRQLAQQDPITTQKLVAFGRTATPGKPVADDASLAAVLGSAAPHICLVAKAWDYHVTVALNTTLALNLESITGSFAAAAHKQTRICDLEHFFDGYKANPEYTIATAKAALAGGAQWLVLCDTNGGTLPHEILQIVPAALAAIRADYPQAEFGIHTHNDLECAVANSLLALDCGVRQLQGTLLGLGERCGNASLTSLLPTLLLKAHCQARYETALVEQALPRLGEISHQLATTLARPMAVGQAYYGANAFVTKAGLHASALLKNPETYEHVNPALVGNRRKILAADQGGRANTLAALQALGYQPDLRDVRVQALTDEVKQLTSFGYAFDQAEASFALLARRRLAHVPDVFKLLSFAVDGARGPALASNLVQGWVKVAVRGRPAEGLGIAATTAEALWQALQEALVVANPAHAPLLAQWQLTGTNLRTLSPAPMAETERADPTMLAISQAEQLTRVLLRFVQPADASQHFTTIGVGANPTDAVMEALRDGALHILLPAPLANNVATSLATAAH